MVVIITSLLPSLLHHSRTSLHHYSCLPRAAVCFSWLLEHVCLGFWFWFSCLHFYEKASKFLTGLLTRLHFTGLLGQRSRHGLHTMRPHLLLFGMYKSSEDVSDLQKEDREGCADVYFMTKVGVLDPTNDPQNLKKFTRRRNCHEWF